MLKISDFIKHAAECREMAKRTTSQAHKAQFRADGAHMGGTCRRTKKTFGASKTASATIKVAHYPAPPRVDAVVARLNPVRWALPLLRNSDRRSLAHGGAISAALAVSARALPHLRLGQGLGDGRQGGTKPSGKGIAGLLGR